MEDWAETRAREWINRQEVMLSRAEEESSLAALLREVATEKEYAQWQYSQHTVAEERDKLLAEVRRVVTEVQRDYLHEETDLAFGELWHRLEKLT